MIHSSRTPRCAPPCAALFAPGPALERRASRGARARGMLSRGALSLERRKRDRERCVLRRKDLLFGSPLSIGREMGFPLLVKRRSHSLSLSIDRVGSSVSARVHTSRVSRSRVSQFFRRHTHYNQTNERERERETRERDDGLARVAVFFIFGVTEIERLAHGRPVSRACGAVAYPRGASPTPGAEIVREGRRWV